jgi:hypothetical protein
VVWTLPAGRNWRRLSGEIGDARFEAVVAGKGKVVIVGSVDHRVTFDAGAWWSADGSRWTHVELAKLGDAPVVTTDGARFLAAG